MQISIIVALTDDLLIGGNNQLVWRLPADVQYFKRITLGKPIIMGRKTYESIGRPLPGRRNIVISRDKDLQLSGCEIYDSLDKTLAAVKDSPEVMIIGGAEIYKDALPITDIMYLTFIHHKFHGDTYFPPWNSDEWEEIEHRDCEPDEVNKYAYSFVTLRRKTSTTSMLIDLSLRLLQDNKTFPSGHFGTHVDVYLQTEIPLEYMNSSAIMFDVRDIQDRDIALSDFEHEKVEPNDFVIFRTGMIDKYQYGSKEYFEEHAQLDDKVIQYLLDKKIRFIGIDAAGIKRGKAHVKADKLCEQNSVYVIENLTNLDKLAEQACTRFKITTLWIELPGKTGLPCRVIANLR